MEIPSDPCYQHSESETLCARDLIQIGYYDETLSVKDYWDDTFKTVLDDINSAYSTYEISGSEVIFSVFRLPDTGDSQDKVIELDVPFDVEFRAYNTIDQPYEAFQLTINSDGSPSYGEASGSDDEVFICSVEWPEVMAKGESAYVQAFWSLADTHLPYDYYTEFKFPLGYGLEDLNAEFQCYEADSIQGDSP